ncbi:DUF262 domain-containing protein [Leuconostoc suionicum]|uniref:DUF262 domain-containing protein n=1 Tax=Leuconostoc suionicum TaxID=1511761 RepID=UPI0032DEC257
MKSKEKMTLQGLLSDEILIPAIQRDYAFGRSNIESKQKRINFVSSLSNVINGNEENLHLDFIYGKHVGDSFIPLDGQQRITTLWLLAIYLSRKNNKTDDYLSRFTYATRTCTREFCSAIIEEAWNPDETSVDYFQSRKWFFNSWRYDPTISGMLVMLEEIHKQLPNGGNYDNLTKITFSFLDVEELGQPEELYVKMNSRGKPLSEWDNFKAELFGILDSDDFKDWIDNDFLDFFWKLGNDGEDKAENTESRMLRFFYLNIFLNRLMDGQEKNNDEIMQFIHKNWDTLIDYQFLSDIKHFIEMLDKFKNDISQYVSDRFVSIRENDFFKILKATKNEDFVRDLDLYFAYWKYISQVNEETFDIDELFNVVRISTNIEESYRKEVGNTRTSLKSFEYAISWQKGIIDYLATQDLTNISFGAYSDEQKNEEVVKAKLILENTAWVTPIYKAESHPYFNGTIGWILRVANEDLEEFIKYSKRLLKKFDKNGIKDKTEIADMLRYSDIRMNRFFPKNSGDGNVSNLLRDRSWKKYFRDRGYKKEKIDIEWIKQWYKTDFINVSELEVWKQWIISYPKIVNRIGAVDVWEDTVFGLLWRVGVFNSNKFSLPIIAAQQYLGDEFSYSGNMDETINTVNINKSRVVQLSFDNKKQDFVIAKDDVTIEAVSALPIVSSIDRLKKVLDGPMSIK